MTQISTILLLIYLICFLPLSNSLNSIIETESSNEYIESILTKDIDKFSIFKHNGVFYKLSFDYDLFKFNQNTWELILSRISDQKSNKLFTSLINSNLLIFTENPNIYHALNIYTLEVNKLISNINHSENSKITHVENFKSKVYILVENLASQIYSLENNKFELEYSTHNKIISFSFFKEFFSIEKNGNKFYLNEFTSNFMKQSKIFNLPDQLKNIIDYKTINNGTLLISENFNLYFLYLLKDDSRFLKLSEGNYDDIKYLFNLKSFKSDNNDSFSLLFQKKIVVLDENQSNNSTDFKSNITLTTKTEDKNEITIKKDGKLYAITTDCVGNCNNNGMCFNSECFCNQGFTGIKCENKVSNDGYYIFDWILWIIVSFGSCTLITLVILFTFYNK